MAKPCILVPLDLSDITETVLLEARRLAAALSAEICLFHVGRDGSRTGGMEFSKKRASAIQRQSSSGCTAAGFCMTS